MKIAIVGAGIAGLTAAHDLLRAGHRVVVYEAGSQAGGLASGFRDDRWAWPLERFYHHIFTTDAAIIKLVHEIGFADRMFFRRPLTAQWWNDRGYALTGARAALPLPDLLAGGLAVLGYPGLAPLDRVRLNVLLAYLKLGVRDWRPLERVTAAAWTRRWGGDSLYRGFFQPLLEGKFGPYAEQVNMAWLWSRFKARSVQLGYFVGGFQGLADALAADVQAQGGSVQLRTPVAGLAPLPGGGWRVAPAHGSAYDADAVIVTGAPGLLARRRDLHGENRLELLHLAEHIARVLGVFGEKRLLVEEGAFGKRVLRPVDLFHILLGQLIAVVLGRVDHIDLDQTAGLGLDLQLLLERIFRLVDIALRHVDGRPRKREANHQDEAENRPHHITLFPLTCRLPPCGHSPS